MAVSVRKDPRFAERAYSSEECAGFYLPTLKKEETALRGMSAGRNCWKGSGIYALADSGLASTVMKEWGLRNGKNVGEMVFLLIEEDVFPDGRSSWMISGAS